MPKKIIVIHTYEDLSRLLEMWLVDDGYQTQIYADREQASRDLRNHQPDLIIIEPSFGNPQQDWHFIRSIRSIYGSTALPVILCTVDTATINEQNNYFQSTLKDILVKPFENELLLEAVKDMLK